MKYLVDYHCHTLFSDGHNTHEEIIAEAKTKNLNEIGFSDHISINPTVWHVKESDYQRIIDKITTLSIENGNEIKIRFGIEMDYFPNKENEIENLIKKFPIDYVLGSVHYIDDWNFDSANTDYDKWNNSQLYLRYFELVQNAAKSGLFDTLSHLDLIKKFKYWPNFDTTDLYNKTLDIIAETNTPIEINTSGIDRPCNEFFPSRKIIELAYKKGIKITLGSDAHYANQVGRHFNIAIAMLKEIGYKSIVTFEKREKIDIEI